MKNIRLWAITFLLILSSLSVRGSNDDSYRVLVTSWEYADNFDYMMVLETPWKEWTFVLDCQSFFHELVLYNGQPGHDQRLFEYYLDPRTCSELGSYVMSETDQGRYLCFDYNGVDKTISIHKDTQFCY
jgi:hypothetical protein